MIKGQKQFKKVAISWNTKKEIILRLSIIAILLFLIFINYILGTSVSYAYAYNRYLFGLITNKNLADRNFISGFIGMGIVAIFFIPWIVFIIKAKNAVFFKKSILYLIITSIAFWAFQLGLGIYSLLYVLYWQTFFIMVLNSVFVVVVIVLSIILRRYINKNWILFKALDYHQSSQKYRSVIQKRKLEKSLINNKQNINKGGY